ncbi:Cleavage and polyadenylation specificity factor subunit 5 [Entamoeba marina]
MNEEKENEKEKEMEVETKENEDNQNEENKEEKESNKEIHRLLPPRLKIFSVTNYTIKKNVNKKRIKRETTEYSLSKLKLFVENNHVPRVCVYGVIIVHSKNFPHLLVLKEKTAIDSLDTLRLIGGKLKVGENLVDGLKRKINNKLHLSESSDYEVGELLGTFYRPSFSSNIYPYIPPHVKQPKEEIHLYMIHLNENCSFEIHDTHELNSIALFSVFDGNDRYNTIICSIPSLISRYVIING